MIRSLLNHRRPATTPWDVICWWERLRWVYNGAVGAAGAIAVLGYALLVSVYSWGTGTSLLQYYVMQIAIPVVVYAVAANLFYTAGWISEVLLVWYTDIETEDFAKIAFVGGTVLSVILTILPGLFLLLFGILGLLFSGVY